MYRRGEGMGVSMEVCGPQKKKKEKNQKPCEITFQLLVAVYGLQ